MTEPLGSPAESSLLQAASRNIDHLQHAVGDLQKAAASAKAEAAIAKTEARNAATAANTAREEAKRWKLLTRVLGFFVILALVASGLSVYNWAKAIDATNQLRSQTISACMQGNQRAAGTVRALDELVVLLEGPDPTAAVKAEAAKYEAFVLNNNAPRNCAQAFSASAKAAG